MKKIAIGFVVAGLLIAAAVVILLRPAAAPTLDTPLPPAPDATGAVTITMRDDGFDPSSVTIGVGQTVTFVNAGASDHWPASGIHPTHEIYPEFDPRRGIAPGSSWSFRFDRAGIWRFHDHLFANLTGTVTVQ